jgi:hypothetical protein
VVPGTYTATIKVGEQLFTQEIKLKDNPNYGLSTAAYKEYDSFMEAAENTYTQMALLVNRLYKVSGQLEALLIKTQDFTATAAIKNLHAEITAWDALMIQRKSKAYDDVENFPNKFTAEYLYVINQSHSDIPRINQGAKDRIEVLNAQWESLHTTAKSLLEEKLPALNALLWKSGMGALNE